MDKIPPLLLADMQNTRDTDTSELRMLQITKTGFQVKVEEEKPKDKEVNHPAEAVECLVFEFLFSTFRSIPGFSFPCGT